MNMQLGGGFYLGGGGQTTLKDVVTGNSQVPIEISFNNTHMSGYGLARFMKAAEGKRRTAYVDFHAGMRSSSSTMVVHTDDHEDCATTSLSNSIGFSGGAGIGMLLNVTSFMSVDFGLQWHGTTSPGKYVDMKSVRNSGDGISYSLNNAQPGMLFIKAGLQIQLNKKGCCGVRNCSIPAHHQNCGAGH